MRPSSKTTILEAARRVAEHSGIGGLTLDAAAQEAGLSKPGLMYHFAGKEQLRVAVAEYITANWEEAMLAELGKPFDEATAAERVRAYCRVAADVAGGKADLAIFVDSMHEESWLAPWRALLRRWLEEPAPLAQSAPDSRSVDMAVARLAADGLWMADASGTSGYDQAMRAAVVARIERLATGMEQEE
ncbi:TetR/AcrR family transcriptional regulator [Saccharopolyspora sp. NPDC050389]|uniref:TetR/AcrR family transcriptional regulator n=1 Tax=Saccharopolyspora sp. NPDC050389 TaxID=3155516 RepID=UPI0033DC9455